MATNYTFNFWLALFFFIVHIIGNLIVTKPNAELFNRLEKLTLFPPGWVFSIWLVILGLQAALFYKTFGGTFWSNTITLLFVLVCFGNIGAQYAGAKNLGWPIYVSLIACMLISAFLFMQLLQPLHTQFR